MTDTFDKFTWIKMLLADTTLSEKVLRLGQVIALYYTRRDGTGWAVDLDEVASRVKGGFTVARFNDAVRHLVSRGFLVEIWRSAGGRPRNGVAPSRRGVFNLRTPTETDAAESASFDKNPSRQRAKPTLLAYKTDAAGVQNRRCGERRLDTIDADQAMDFSPTGTSSGTSSGTSGGTPAVVGEGSRVEGTPGWSLVCQVIPDAHPNSIRQDLAAHADAMLADGTAEADILDGLRRWATKRLPPRFLPELVADVVNARTVADAPGDKPLRWNEKALANLQGFLRLHTPGKPLPSREWLVNHYGEYAVATCEKAAASTLRDGALDVEWSELPELPSGGDAL